MIPQQSVATVPNSVQLCGTWPMQPWSSCKLTEISLLKARFISHISAVSKSIQLIKLDRNSTSESANAFLLQVQLVLSYYLTEMWHWFESQVSAMLNLIHTLHQCIEHVLIWCPHKERNWTCPNATWTYCKTNCCIVSLLLLIPFHLQNLNQKFKSKFKLESFIPQYEYSIFKTFSADRHTQ